jgi:oligosaccharide repeat unit polymerase
MFSFLTSPLIPAFFLLLLAVAGRVVSGSWLASGSFGALLWSVFVWVSMLLTDYPIYASAVWVIVLLVFSLQAGAFIGEYSVVGMRNRPDYRTLEFEGASDRLVSLSIAFSIIASVGAVYFVFWTFSRFDLPASPVSLLGLGHLWSVQRYEYGELEPWPVRLTTMWVYPGALLGGIAYADTVSRKTRLWCLLPFIPALLVGTIVAARAGVLIAAIIWLSGYFGVKYWQSSGAYGFFRKRLLVLLAVLGIAAVLLFLSIDALRQSSDGQTFNVVLDSQRLFKYAFGSLAGFSNWFHESASNDAGLGAYTFGGIFDVLGIKHREIGLYEGMVILPGGEETNIYTAIRGLIQDFTLAGTVILAFFAGLVSSALLRSSWRRPSMSVLFAAGYYAFILCSPLTSIFTYNGVILAWLVASVVLCWQVRIAAVKPRLLPNLTT